MRVERRGRRWVAFEDPGAEEPFAMSRYGVSWFRISDGHTLSGVGLAALLAGQQSEVHPEIAPAPPVPLEPINPKDSLGLTKVSLSKVPVAGIIHEALAMRDGAVKYGPHNWREYPVIATVYYDACLRHMMAWFDGEDLAPDSGVHHLGHAKACLGILLDAMENGKLGDDRPLPGAAARLFAANVQELKPEGD